MNLESIRLVYFSPTGTTKRIIEGIADGVGGAPFDKVDITLQSGRKYPIQTSPVQLLIVGVPVYAGRVPPHALQWLRTIEAHDTPVVCVVVFGNREYDDALLELKETMVGVGCIPIALAAYIGEHSFSDAEIPIAQGRPDADDLRHAESFGRRIKDTLLSLHSINQVHEVPIPGHHPFVEMNLNQDHTLSSRIHRCQ
jgi:flavodoxin